MTTITQQHNNTTTRQHDNTHTYFHPLKDIIRLWHHSNTASAVPLVDVCGDSSAVQCHCVIRCDKHQQGFVRSLSLPHAHLTSHVAVLCGSLSHTTRCYCSSFFIRRESEQGGGVGERRRWGRDWEEIGIETQTHIQSLQIEFILYYWVATSSFSDFSRLAN